MERNCSSVRYRTDVLKVPAGESVSPGQLEVALAQNPDAIAVFATLCETSTGAGHDLAAMGKLVAGTSAILAVDGISGAGAMECRTDAWGIDILVTGSQKALMLPPGLAFLTIEPQGVEAGGGGKATGVLL